ncbi:hypothetical protein AAES_13597 [Amazona aestiva]|uniref:Uncharacterized protein n=1 Tax=Amazona aestiva TaxID=12930 RepID=A0A0Q3XBB3_AMAAE|nr:hypothetical protein AAES_13597 [Amazona aestiva]
MKHGCPEASSRLRKEGSRPWAVTITFGQLQPLSLQKGMDVMVGEATTRFGAVLAVASITLTNTQRLPHDMHIAHRNSPGLMWLTKRQKRQGKKSEPPCALCGEELGLPYEVYDSTEFKLFGPGLAV